MACKSDCFSFAKEAKTRIAIEEVINTISDIGTPIKSWQTLNNAWAMVEPKSINEVFANGQLVSKVIYKIIIRYQSVLSNTALTATYRIDLKGKKLNILGIKNLSDDLKTEGKSYQELSCVEGEIS